MDKLGKIKIQRFKGKVVFNKPLTDKVIHCRIAHIKPKKLNFLPGQFMILLLHSHIKRSYSIGSSTLHDKYFDIYIDTTPKGPGSKFFLNVKKNNIIEYIAPVGQFIYKQKNNPAIFISTGIGITPFISMIEYALRSETKRKLILLEGLRFKNDIFLENKFRRWKKKYNNFDYQFCLSRDMWHGKKGRVTNFLNSLIKKLGRNVNAYICGNIEIVNDIKKELLRLGVKKGNIHYEKYF